MAENPLNSVINNLPLPGKKSTAPDPVISEAEQIARGMISIRDILAPGAMEVDFSYLHIGDVYYRTLFIVGYPRQVGANWLSPLINFNTSLDISMYYYPVSTKEVLKKLRRKITQMEAQMIIDQENGKLPSPEVELNIQDATTLQDELVEGSEKFFQFSLYITIPASSLEELNSITKQMETILGGMLIISKPATLQMLDGFKTSLPTADNALGIMRNMDTTSLATTFPFTSSELTSSEGIMYGLNEHNGSLVIFDRFNLENANMTIFAKSGAGKSYAVKLEAMRSLMLGIEVIVIDPENEYKRMAEAIGGAYIPFDFKSKANINPFDLSTVYEAGENELGLKILNLHGLLKVMFGDLSPTEEAVIDRALVLTYKLKGITPDPDTQKNTPPLLEDLYKVFLGMEEPEATGLADRLERYVKGSAQGLFDKPSNIDLNNTFTVFGVRDLEDSIRPVAMFVILDYIWTNIRRNRKKRILVVDEAWFLMQHPDSAKFLFSLAKRARKYFLGLTTITQDVEDFISTDMGKAIVTNSSLQFLMKQSASSVDKLTEVFYLSSGEKNLLLSSNIGEGLFFAGSAHVALQVIASPDEHRLITTNPRELQHLESLEEDSQGQQIQELLTTESPEATVNLEAVQESQQPSPTQDTPLNTQPATVDQLSPQVETSQDLQTEDPPAISDSASSLRSAVSPEYTPDQVNQVNLAQLYNTDTSSDPPTPPRSTSGHIDIFGGQKAAPSPNEPSPTNQPASPTPAPQAATSTTGPTFVDPQADTKNQTLTPPRKGLQFIQPSNNDQNS